MPAAQIDRRFFAELAITFHDFDAEHVARQQQEIAEALAVQKQWKREQFMHAAQWGGLIAFNFMFWVGVARGAMWVAQRIFN